MGVTNSKLGATSKDPSSDAKSQQLNKKLKDLENSEKKFVVVWLDKDAKASNAIYRNALERLQRISVSISSFSNPNECLEFLSRMKEMRVLLIIADAFLKDLWPQIRSMNHIYSIYVLSEDDEQSSPVDDDEQKFKGVLSTADPLYAALKRDTRHYKQDILALSIIQSMSYTKSGLKELNQLFIYWFLVKQIILESKFDPDAHQQLAELSREHYRDDPKELKIIEEFNEHYHDHSPVWWYTRECFLQVMLNRALQTQDIEVIIKIAPFIQDLHRQLEQLQRKMSKTFRFPPVVYRSKTLLSDDFAKMKNSEGNLLSFNNFLLADPDEKKSMDEARRAKTTNMNVITLLFRIESAFDDSSSPFALLTDLSSSPEQNSLVLFSLHSIFRIGQIKEIEDRLWIVNLTLTDADDRPLVCLNDLIRDETRQSLGWYKLAKLMVIVRDFQHAKEIYFALLNLLGESDLLKMSHIYNELGLICDEMGEFTQALSFYQKSIEMRQKCLPPNHRLLGIAYNNIGEVQRELGEYFNALSSHQKTLSIKQKTLPPNDLSFATTYNNLGLANEALGDFPTALAFYQKALEIKRKVLSPTHIDLATTYNNIGELQREMGNYSASLTYFEKALSIRQKTTSPTDSSLAVTYNNIGLIHREMGDFPRAVEFFEKSLQVKQKTYRENHPSLAITFINIGDIHQQVGEYAEALNSYRRALDIQEKAFSPHHPEIATTYNNIGVVHQSMGSYPLALSFYQKALKIRQKSLSQSHPAIGTSLNNIGHVSQMMGDNTAALEYYQKTLKLQEKSLRQNHPSIAATYNNIADIQRKLGNLKNALGLYKKCLEIKKKALSPTHPSLLTTYNNIGVIHQSMGEYPAALDYYKKTLEIQQKNLSEHHPDLAAVHNNIGVAHQSLKDFPLALEHYKKALKIQEKSLSEDHPDKATTHNSLATVYVSLNDYDKALFHEEAAVNIAKKALGDDHPNTKTFQDYLERIRYRIESTKQTETTDTP